VICALQRRFPREMMGVPEKEADWKWQEVMCAEILTILGNDT